MRECDANCGMMWARRASSGSCGRSRRHVCILSTVVPSGNVMDIGDAAGNISVAGAFVVR